MKIYNRILSTLLAVLMLLSSLVIGVAAADDTQSSEADMKNAGEVIESTYVKKVHKTPEEKLATMTLMLTRDNYQLYVDPVSGEVATKDKTTGNVLFSNPYDVASSQGSADTKKQIISQLAIQYIDNGTSKYLYSFEEAAMRQQIKVLNIKNGIRVEYTIGREESRKLVPRWISDESFTKYILTPLKAAVEKEQLDERSYQRFVEAFYTPQRLSDKKSKKAKEQLLLTHPICEKMDIWVLSSDVSSAEINWIEERIKAYCEDYSFEQMDADHEETGYEAKDEKYPLFKMALEYSLDQNGLNVTLPCNGLRYDMSTYTLENLSILPYMGAGNSENPGYNFYPDGAGSLFDFEQLNTKSATTVRGKVYGVDYAYHQISGTYQKAIRYPVYGTVATEKIYSFTFATKYKLDENLNLVKENGDAVDTGDSNTYTVNVSNTVMSKEDIEKFVADRKGTLVSKITVDESYKRGFVAVIKEGESLAEIATYHAGSMSDYNTMMNYFNPKPKDSYDIADSISVTTSSSWTVVSERKYTGNITIGYQMLTDKTVAEKIKETDSTFTYYDTTWLGMAEAYRDYLVGNGTLSKMTAEETEQNIPLYLEVFGALETQQTIMTVPVDVMTPLTTFENVIQMYNQLSDKGVKNINFKMTGFANGGMYATVPAKLKWEKAVGGADGFRELIAQAATINADADKNIGLYPDFDFAYIHENTLFDSTNLKKDAIKTIDNRYSSLRQYSATKQTYVSFFQLAISPSRYSKFYTKLLDNYSEYGLKSMSIASLGTALNSDFDEDDPYNREDGKGYTMQAFQDLRDAGYSLMTEGANAYTWGYVDHIINVDLDSSRYIKSSASVPFIGTVLHGYVQFAGNPFNEEGDTSYALLRALENGAGLYFILSYQNTHELKEDSYLSQYYSVRYDIWENDVVKYYQELNGLLNDVQNKVIIDHQFLTGQRVLDLDELEAELEQMLKDAEEAEKLKQEALSTAKVLEVANAWKTASTTANTIKSILATMGTHNENMEAKRNALNEQIAALPEIVQDVLDSMSGKYMDFEGFILEADEAMALNGPKLTTQLVTIKSLAADVYQEYAMLGKLVEEGEALLEAVKEAYKVIDEADLSDTVKQKMLAEVSMYLEEATALFTLGNADTESAYALYAKNVAMVDATDNSETTKSVAVHAVAALDLIKAEDDYAQYAEDLAALVASSLFTVADVEEAGKLNDEILGDDDSDNEQNVHDRYYVDNNQIVVVTYGDRDDTTHEKTAYKSFILNYNNFAVVVDYEGVKYTIPSGGYVVLYAD